MPNYLFPRESSSAFNGGAGQSIKVYNDKACTTAATITSLTGTAIGGGTLTLDGSGNIPAFMATQAPLYAALASVTNPDSKGASVMLTPVGEAAAGSSEFSGVLLNLPSGAYTTTWTSWDFATGDAENLAVDINVTAVSGTTPSLTPSIQRKGADGAYYTIWTGTAMTATGQQSASIGVSAPTNAALGEHCRLILTISGTTPSFTLTASVEAAVNQ